MSSTTTLYLVRHGETDYNRDDVYQGTLDIPLNTEGRVQVCALAKRLVDVPFSAVYTSPLSRARETAYLIVREIRGGNTLHGPRALRQHAGAEIRRVPPPIVVIPELREFSYGEWQGLSQSERQQADATLESLWQTDPWQTRFPGGESLHEVRARVIRVIDDLVVKHRHQTILVSGHGHVNRLIIAHLAQFGQDSFWDIEQPNGSSCKLTIRD